jgi:hypothetical protein
MYYIQLTCYHYIHSLVLYCTPLTWYHYIHSLLKVAINIDISDKRCLLNGILDL